MRASPQCHDLPLQPAHAVVLKFLHGLYVLVAGTDSRVHLLRILAQHRGARRADRPRSVTLESVSTCHPFCSGPCIRFGNPCIRNDNWQRLCSPLPPVPVPQPAQLSRKSATHSRRRRHRQPHASCAHPCTAPCARPCSSTPQLGSRTGFNLPSVLHRSMHMVPQQPALLMTMPWPARVQTIAANSRHRNAPSGQSSVTRGASIQTTVVRTTRAPLGAPACVTLLRVQARDCRNIEPNQVHISNTNCIAAAAHRALRVSQRLRRFPRKTLPNRG